MCVRGHYGKVHVFSLLSGWAAWHLAHLLEFSHSDALRGAAESHSWWVSVWGFCLRRCPAMHLKSSFCMWVLHKLPPAPSLSLLLRSCFLFITLQSDSNSITHVHSSGAAFKNSDSVNPFLYELSLYAFSDIVRSALPLHTIIPWRSVYTSIISDEF